ncbi:hypothetical protein EMCRGX_G007910 [Ephydatia muelleri]
MQSSKVAGVSGKVTVTSKAAGFALSQALALDGNYSGLSKGLDQPPLLQIGLSAHLEEGSSWSIEKPKSHPADILVANWDRGFSAAFDVSVTSPLNPLHIVDAGISPGVAAKATEERKHRNNDAKCDELGWHCIPMVVESYSCWGTEARQALSQSLYGRLNLT